MLITKIKNFFISSKLWLLIGVVLAGMVFVVLDRCAKSSNEIAGFYILSSIAQGLAALLAIVLTATLIIVQIFRRFTAWRMAMSFETIILIVAYSLGIILPLIFLRIGVQSWMLNFSIALTFLCIIVLIPFLRHIGTLFVNPIVLGMLEKSILEARDGKAYGEVINLLQDFHQAWLSAIDQGKTIVMPEFKNAWINIRNHIANQPRVQDSLFIIVFSITEQALRRNYEDYAKTIYASHSIPEDFIEKYYNFYRTKSIEIIKMAYKKKFLGLCKYIIIGLRHQSYRFYHKKGSTSDKEQEPKALITELLTINPQLTEETLRGNAGNGQEFQLFKNWLDEIQG